MPERKSDGEDTQQHCNATLAPALRDLGVVSGVEMRKVPVR
jgi:hypothetical protein